MAEGSYCREYPMRYKLIPAFLLVVAITVTSCRPMKEMTIDVLKPAEITIPGEIERIAFANRSSPMYITHKETDTVFRSRAELLVVDTIFQIRHYKGLFEALGNDLLFNVEDQHILVMLRTDTIVFPAPLSAGQISGISDTSITDALISLEGYELKDTAFYRFSYYDNYYHVFFRITGRILWRIYDVRTGIVLDDYTLSDTLQWEASGYLVQIALLDLPVVSDAYREFGFQSGLKYGWRLTPEWFEEFRYFYTGSWSWRYATSQVTVDNWEEALKVWKELAGLNRKRLAAKAAFNIALYYEMEDRLVPALDWAKKSREFHNFKLTGEYITLLEKRIADRLTLQQQIPLE